MLCYLYETGLLLKLTSETIDSKKKVWLSFATPFIHRTSDPGWKNSRIRDPR
jgi:hypothetical protein